MSKPDNFATKLARDLQHTGQVETKNDYAQSNTYNNNKNQHARRSN
jgi:hypothetical protein